MIGIKTEEFCHSFFKKKPEAQEDGIRTRPAQTECRRSTACTSTTAHSKKKTFWNSKTKADNLLKWSWTLTRLSSSSLWCSSWTFGWFRVLRRVGGVEGLPRVLPRLDPRPREVVVGFLTSSFSSTCIKFSGSESVEWMIILRETPCGSSQWAPPILLALRYLCNY